MADRASSVVWQLDVDGVLNALAGTREPDTWPPHRGAGRTSRVRGLVTSTSSGPSWARSRSSDPASTRPS